MSNEHLVLVCGTSGQGKSMSLMNIDNPEGVLYLNTEAGKRLPFKNTFISKTILDPYQIYEAITYAETKPEIHTIVIDSLVMMMDMFESMHVLGTKDTMKGWSNYAQFFKKLMNQYVASSTKTVIFTSHVMDILNESEMSMERLVKVKGSLMNTSIEAYFSVVVAAVKMPLEKLKDYANPLLNVTPEEEILGFKHCYQVGLTKETVSWRLRGPFGMWQTQELFIDNDAQMLINRLNEYYT